MPACPFLLSPAIFHSRPPSSRVYVSPAQMCQLEVSLGWLHCRRSYGSCCASVWGRWRPSSSGRWPSWRRRRASFTTKRQLTANAQKALSIPSWRGSPSLRKVSDTVGNVKCWPYLMKGFFCLAGLTLISQSLCKFLMTQGEKPHNVIFFFWELFSEQLLVLEIRLGKHCWIFN